MEIQITKDDISPELLDNLFKVASDYTDATKQNSIISLVRKEGNNMIVHMFDIMSFRYNAYKEGTEYLANENFLKEINYDYKLAIEKLNKCSFADNILNELGNVVYFYDSNSVRKIDCGKIIGMRAQRNEDGSKYLSLEIEIRAGNKVYIEEQYCFRTPDALKNFLIKSIEEKIAKL